MTITLQVVDRLGATVQQKSETLAADRFAGGRTVDHQFDVPLSHLAPGPHLLRVQAMAGSRSVHREVRFTARR